MFSIFSMSMETRKDKIYDAILNNDIQTVRKLLINQSNVDINMGWGFFDSTALNYACKCGKVEIAQLLLDHGANIEQTDVCGMTALHCACRFVTHHVNPSTVQLLLQRGANVNQQDDRGNTPLHQFCRFARNETGFDLEVVKKLLQYKADPTIKNSDGQTPMDFAKEQFGDDSILLKLMNDRLKLQKKEEAQQQQLQLQQKKEEAQQQQQLQLQQDQKFYQLLLQPFKDHYVNNNYYNKQPLSVAIKDGIIKSIHNVNHLKVFYTYIRQLQLLQEICDDEASIFITTAMEEFVPKITTEDTFTVFELVLLKALQDKLITTATKISLNRRAEKMETSNSKFVNDIRMDIYRLQQHVDYLDQRVTHLGQRVDHIDDKITSLSRSVQKFQNAIKRKSRIEAATGFVACLLNAASFGVAGTAVQGVVSTAMTEIVDFGDIVHIESIVDNLPNNDVLKEAMHVGLEAAEEVSVQDMAEMAMDQMADHYDRQAEKALKEAVDKFAAKCGSGVRGGGGGGYHHGGGTMDPPCGEETSLLALVFVAKLTQLKTTSPTTSAATTVIGGAAAGAKKKKKNTLVATTTKKKGDDSNVTTPANEKMPTKNDDEDYLLEPTLDLQDMKEHKLNLFIAIHGGDEDDINDELDELGDGSGGSDINHLVDSRGRTATDFAAIMGQVDTMNRLIKERNGKFKIRPRAFMKQLARRRAAATAAAKEV